MKDFYDVWTLLRQFSFRGSDLAAALRSTFLCRGSRAERDVFSEIMGTILNSDMKWNNFLRINKLDANTPLFESVMQSIEVFILPVMDAIEKNALFNLHWEFATGWK